MTTQRERPDSHERRRVLDEMVRDAEESGAYDLDYAAPLPVPPRDERTPEERKRHLALLRRFESAVSVEPDVDFPVGGAEPGPRVEMSSEEGEGAMTTQRDRLAAVLHETWRETHDNNWTFDDWADALLARGVRVVDERVLDEATVNRCHVDIAWDCASCRRAVNELLAELEGRDLYDEDAEQRFLEPIGIDRDGMASIMRNLKR